MLLRLLLKSLAVPAGAGWPRPLNPPPQSSHPHPPPHPSPLTPWPLICGGAEAPGAVNPLNWLLGTGKGPVGTISPTPFADTLPDRCLLPPPWPIILVCP